MKSLFIILVAISACVDAPTSTCTTTLWAERTPDVIVCDSSGCVTREVYAVKVITRIIEGTPCEAEEYLAERERPLAWSHDCGCDLEVE